MGTQWTRIVRLYMVCLRGGGVGEMVQLDGYTVDVPEAIHGMCEGGDGTSGWVHSGLE